MKYFSTKVVLGFAVVLFAAVAAVKAETDDRSFIFSTSLEHKTLTELGVKFAESGNSAAGYLPYLNGTAPSLKTPWFQALNLKNAIDPEDDEGKKAQAAALAAAGPDLEALIAASRKQDYVMWGTLVKPDPKVTPFSITTLNFIDLTRLAYLLVGDAKLRAAQGDSSAEERLLAAVRIGHHMEEDVESFAIVWGSLVKSKAATALSELYDKQGKKDLAQSWKQYAGSMEFKRKVVIETLKEMPGWSQAQTEAFVRNDDYPTSMRLEALIVARYCISSREAGLKCRIIGPPGWAKKLEQEAKFSDPQAASILALLKNPITLDELSWVEFAVPDKD